ncbi:testis-expressed protein 26 isoform X1 [Ictalurus furcatus]|uniref:testis-expressed protein 26 isoform X1 n=1 Tax=Ictalurus furcatus TaxID=66913 RepID=UPI00234FF611|nr:testis-expressed protein 26 isoform X1 [Ictalurus furcatus]XP_053502727.1 testis-expressed protein 26 isoform X1 [Ictalurus furcatus]XP_053502728.1 testis-expressed protein 26 isoform X1 [Ictalurus furcatus]XP_053502729.1 testis-expressed protein 26 isoform X1 [Ictalurus furcatus]
MASCDVRKWDPYETSQKRDFVERPSSPIPVLRPPTSRAYRTPYALADPIGVTGYSEDFSWKPPSKPECIRTGTASGNRRNNPHPSQSFMVWRRPPGLKLCENPPPEDEVKHVLSAQYKSTYRTDFLGIPQGMMMNHRALDPVKHIPEVPQCIQTEMRYNYRKPVQRPEFRGNLSRPEASKGIVPTVVPKHITNQESTKPLTTYDRHFSGKSTDFASVLSSLKPEELQHFYKHLPEKEKMLVQTFLQKKQSPPGQGKKIMEPVAFTQPPAALDRISIWPGPL